MRLPASVDEVGFHLDNAQWWPQHVMRRQQADLLAPLVAHAYRTVAWYRRRFDDLGLHPDQIARGDVWHSVPLLTRTDIQNAGELLHTRHVPVEHGQVFARWTGGSTATPVMVLATELTEQAWRANTLREHRWQGRNLSGKLAVIRCIPDGHAAPPAGARLLSWDAATAGRLETGPCVVLSIKSDTREQAEWLIGQQPTYLQTYPSVVFELAQHFLAKDQRLESLEQVSTFGEVVEPKTRQACLRAWGVELFDGYSTNEVGHVAIECAQHSYHVQSEHLLVEVLDSDGRPCQVGETGRVVITDLFNYAMPLLRYDIGDYAEVGGPCACGRNLPTIRRILGRQRNMFVLPSGEKRWPALDIDPAAAFDGNLPVRQFQAIQRSRHDVEVKLVVARPLSRSEEEAIRAMLVAALDCRLTIRFTYVDHIPRGPTGKFEDFRCDVSPRETPQRAD